MKRKQAAVVFNDIQGYTSLMQENESFAVEVRQRHKEVVDRLTKAYKGTIIQYYGDGTLSIFDRSIDAVQCALNMQKEFHEPPRIPLRIGINSGDILLGPDGIYGDSVNIASRIERMSVPGSVIISDRVWEEIKNQEGIQTKELGQFELKNVRFPIGLHAVISDGVIVPESTELSGKLGYKEKSILVLPFNNLSKDPDNESFSDEMTEQVIAALSQIEGLRVTSRTSSFAFKDKVVNLRQLHQELGINNVLEGSVRMHGQKVRITAQLVNAADDFQLWSETYGREVSDVFQIQDEIAAMICQKLKASFIQSAARSGSLGAKELVAEQDAAGYFRKGMYYWKQMQAGFMDQALEHYKKALAVDAGFFQAWPSLATVYAFKALYNQMLPVDAAQCCMDSLEEATRINPDHSRTHTGWALYHMFFSWNWTAASHHLKLALAHQDSDQFFYHSTLLRAGGMYLVSTCHFDDAIAMYKKALKMEPMNIAIQLELARAYAYKRDYLVALETVESMIRSRPDFLPAFEAKGWILFSMGRQRKGIEAFEYARQHATLPITALAGQAYAYARTSQAALAESTRQLLQSLYQDLPNHVPHLDLALAHLGALEYEPMFDQLQKAAASKMPMLIFLEANPIWDEIRRFNAYRELKKTIFGEDQRPPL